MKRLLLLIIIASLNSLVSFAQTELQATYQPDKSKAAEVGGVVSTYADCALVYTVTLTDEDADRVKSFTIDGNTFDTANLTFTADHKLQFDCDVTTYSTPGVSKHTLQLTYTTTVLDEENGERVAGDDKTAETQVAYTIYSPPDFSAMRIDTKSLVNFASDFTFNVSGLQTSLGNPEGWTLVWALDGQKQPETNTPTYKPATLTPEEHTISLRAINRISADLYKEGTCAEVTVKALSDPEFSFTLASDPSAHVQDKGSDFTFTVTNPEEGDDSDAKAWTYIWTVDGVAGAMEGKQVTYSLAQVRKYTVTLIATCVVKENTDVSKVKRKTIEVNVFADGSIDTPTYDSNVEAGGTSTFVVNLKGGQNGKWTDARAMINGEPRNGTINGNTATFSYTAPSVISGDSRTIEVTEIHAENQPDNCPDKVTLNLEDLHYSITVWKASTVSQTAVGDNDIKDDAGQELVVALNGGVRAGGTPAFDTTNGWKCVWRIDGKDQTGNSDRFPLHFIDGLPHTYSVTVYSYLSGRQVYSQTFNWEGITVWTKPAGAKVNFYGFEGEATYCSYDLTGGYTGIEERGGWLLKVKKVGVDGDFHTISDKLLKTLSGDFKMPVITISGEQYEWRMQNFWKDGTPWEPPFGQNDIQTTEVSSAPSLRVENLPEFKYDALAEVPTFTGETDVYYDNGINFSLNKLNGFQDRWYISLDYTDINGVSRPPELASNRKEIGETLISFPDIWTTNRGDDVRDIHVSGQVENGMGSNKKTINVNLTFHVWPKLKVTALNADPVMVREGDPVALTAQINPCYTSASNKSIGIVYEYSMSGFHPAGTPEATQEIAATMTPGVGQATEFVTAKAQVRLVGRHGEEWSIKTPTTTPEDQAQAVITVFRKPQLPESIQLFGNGNTGTYYLQMEEDDATLEAQKYKYYIADGVTGHGAHSDFRWVIIPSDWSEYNLRAATYWDYDAHTRVYSDYRLYNGAMAHCDLSRIGNFDNRGVDQGDQSGVIALPAVPVQSEDIYDMTGRRVERLHSGKLYIVGGKKVIGK